MLHDQQFYPVKQLQFHYIDVNVTHHVSLKDESKFNKQKWSFLKNIRGEKDKQKLCLKEATRHNENILYQFDRDIFGDISIRIF